MDQVISFIQKLIDEEAAYQVDGDVYFRVNADQELWIFISPKN